MKVLILAILTSLTLLITAQASALTVIKKYYYGPRTMGVPTANCVTHATKAPLPQYVCCKKYGRHGRLLWQNTWVPGSCWEFGARKDRIGCGVDSPVLGTGAPIMGSCQFSHTTLGHMYYPGPYYYDQVYPY